MVSLVVPLWVLTFCLTPPPAPPSTPAARLSAAAIEELLEIRRQGGSLLEGTVFGPGGEFGSSDTEFAEMLRRVAAEEAGRSPARLRVPLERPPQRLDSPAAFGEETDAELLDSLEASIELLHAKIGRLERAGSYALSDQLQRTLRQLRLAARAIRAGSVEEAESPASAEAGFEPK